MSVIGPYPGLMGFVWIVRLGILTVPYLSGIRRSLFFPSTK